MSQVRQTPDKTDKKKDLATHCLHFFDRACPPLVHMRPHADLLARLEHRHTNTGHTAPLCAPPRNDCDEFVIELTRFTFNRAHVDSSCRVTSTKMCQGLWNIVGQDVNRTRMRRGTCTPHTKRSCCSAPCHNRESRAPKHRHQGTLTCH